MVSNKEAIIVGINNYAIAPALRHAIHDASELASALQMAEYGFDTSLLLDGDATTSGLKAALSTLLKGPAEMTLFFFAGHGYANYKEVYLVTSDGSDDCPGISVDWLRGQVLAAKKTVILILDCCHAGAASVRTDPAWRGLSEGDIERTMGSLGSGKILLAACAPNETAAETQATGHGIFTFHLLEGLMGQASNLRGIVTPIGLFDYIAGRFGEDGLQTPTFKGEQAGSVILGAGFAPPAPFSLNPLTSSDTAADLDVLSQLEQQASQHLSTYLEQTTLPYERWKTEGFRKATQLLEPVLRWFGRTISENPELLSRPTFAEAYSEAKARLTQLGALSEGTHTDVGRVEKRLGSGAFGTVWRVESSDQRVLAYKVYHSTEIDLREKVARFERGYRAMQQLEHPHIVKVHRYTNCPIGFSMDFVDGPNLRDFIGPDREPREILELLITVAETLQHAHGRNVIHRDVKPENIVLAFDSATKIWVPYLTDFDLAWFSAATQLTKDAFGAIFYAAPEQLTKPSSRLAHAPTTDIYSFGQLCFFVATGSDPVPFGGADNSSGLRRRIGHWRVEQAANIFADLYDRCINQDPDLRIQDFRTISDKLFEAHRLIREIDVTERINAERFLRELVYALAGLSDDQTGTYESFDSLSGRSLISVTGIGESDDELEFTVCFKQERLSIPGATSESARRILNARLDKAMSGYPNVTRRSGREGAYQVFLGVTHINMSLGGVDQSRSIIARAIDTIESG